MKYNIYCDESCHLEHDNSKVMILGAMQCPKEKKADIFKDIRQLKIDSGLDSYFEIKWTKVSKSKVDFYEALFDYFWNTDDLSYRGLVIKGKEKLNHVKYNFGNHNLWYYKMYFIMLNPIIDPEHQYDIFLDIKDTNGGKNVQKLHNVLCNNAYDFKHDVIKHISQINSKESEVLQLADLMNGALGYYHRGLYKKIGGNEGKKVLVDNILSHRDIRTKTSRYDEKFNMLVWTPRE